MQIKYNLPALPHNIVDLYNQYVKKRKISYKKQAGQLSTVCKLLKVSVGTVVLALPDGFRRVYVLGGVLTLIICGVLQCYSWNLLVQVIEEKARIHNEQKEQEEKDKEKQKNEENKQPIEIEMQTQNGENGNQDMEAEVEIDQNFQDQSYLTDIQEEVVEDKIQDSQQDQPKENPFLFNRLMFQKMNMIGVLRVISPDSIKMIIFIQVITLILFFGQAVSLIIFFNQTLEAFKSDLNKKEEYKILFASLMIIIIMLFSFVKRMEDLRGLINMGSYLVFIVMYFFISICLFQIKSNPTQLENKVVNFGINYAQIPFFFGVSLFSYDINGLLTEIREEMKSPQFFKKNLTQSMIICGIIYILVGMTGYIAYGQYTNTLLTVDLDNTINEIGQGVRYALLTLQLFYSLSMVLTVVLQNVVTFRLLEELPQDAMRNWNVKYNVAVRMLIRFLYISACVFTATYFQNFTVVISLLGSITSVTLGFILPYYLFNLVFLKTKKPQKILNSSVLSLGVIGGLLGVISVFVQI